METKISIRKRILTLRNEMTKTACIEKSRQIMLHLLSIPVIRQAETILCYAGYKNEVMTGELITELHKAGKHIFLPRVNGEEMDFYQIKSLLELRSGYKGIPEPDMDCTDIFTKDMWELQKEKTVMILPGAAFCESGARIGYGKGYYDRYLTKIPCTERIALCYEFQIVPVIPADPHDIPVTAIVTEEKIRSMK